MSTFIAWCAALWRNLLRRKEIEADLHEELRSQMELLIDQYSARGMSREESQRQARLEFGGLDQVKEGVRSVRRGHWLDEISRDVQYGTRSLLRSPTFAAVSILTIGLSIGANTTIFTIVNGAAFRPFTLPGGDPIMSVTQRLDGDYRRSRRMRFEANWVSYPEYQTYRDGSHVLAGLAAYAPNVRATLGGDQPRALTGTLVSCNYFDVLEARIALGRGFGDDCATAEALSAVVLSDDIWRSAFAADPQVVGKPVTLNRQVFTIVGIAPPAFTPPGPLVTAFWAPLAAQPVFIQNLRLLDAPDGSWLAMLARPNKGVSLAEMRAGLDVIARQLDQQTSTRRTTLIIEPTRMLDMPQASFAAVGIGAILLVAVALVLMVACANVANMLIARSAARRREIAVRLALGASRWRLVRQLFTESLLLAAAGGILGLLLGVWASATLLRIVTSLLPAQIPRLAFSADVDLRVLAYASGVTCLTALISGLLPALRASRPNLSGDLKQECGELASEGHSAGWWRHLLLTGQMFVSMVLLLAAGLLCRGLYQAETIEPGFKTTGISVLKIDTAGYSAEAATRVQRAVLARVSALPGVTTAQAWVTPLSGETLETRFSLDDGAAYAGSWNMVSSNYFSLLGTSIVRGRGFTVADERDHAGVVIVTESTARRFWRGADPIGKKLRYQRGPNDGEELADVVGVVKDAQLVRLGDSGSTFAYFPASAQDQSNLALLVSREGGAGQLAVALRAAVRAVDPQLVAAVSALEDNLGLWRGLSRLAAVTAAVVAGLALLLATIGAYGVVAFTVSRRRREIGIRVALGATNRDVVGLVLRQTMRPVMIGAFLGTLCGAALSRLMSALLFGLSPYDPLSFVAVPLILLAIAALASYLPARRAMRVDPLVALRYE